MATKKLNGESIKDKNTQQLIEMLGTQREELRALRFAAAGSRPKDSAAPKKTRASIARIMTEIHARKEDEAVEVTEAEAATA